MTLLSHFQDYIPKKSIIGERIEDNNVLTSIYFITFFFFFALAPIFQYLMSLYLLTMYISVQFTKCANKTMEKIMSTNFRVK